MAITQAQVEEARDKLGKVQEAASRVNEILVKVNEVILGDAEGNSIVNLTTTQKDKLKAEYTKAKAALTNSVAQLP